jgi:hypothetical protein
MHSTCLCPPPRTRGCPAQGRRGPCAGAPASCAAPTRGGRGGGPASVCLSRSDLSHGLSVHLSAYLRLYVCLSVCLKVCFRLPVTDGHGHGSAAAAVFHFEVWSCRRNSVRVCPHSRHSSPTGVRVCLSESVCLSVSVSESVCLSPSRCHVTTAVSAGARYPPRPPGRFGRFILSETSVVPEMWLLFFICSALWPKAFRFCNFLFSFLHLRF